MPGGTWRLGRVRREVCEAKRRAHRPERLFVHCVSCLVEGHAIPDHIGATVDLGRMAVKPAWHDCHISNVASAMQRNVKRGGCPCLADTSAESAAHL